MAMTVACFLSMQLPENLRWSCGWPVMSCHKASRNIWPLGDSRHLCNSRNNNRHQTPMHLHQRCGAMLQTPSCSVESTGMQGYLSLAMCLARSWVLLSQLDTSSCPCSVNKPPSNAPTGHGARIEHAGDVSQSARHGIGTRYWFAELWAGRWEE